MIATVINFSSNEIRFLKACLEEALLFSERVIVCFADHFFDGTEENLPLIYGAARAHPEVTFIQYPFSKANFYGDHPPSFWHSLGRMIGSRWVEESEYLLFLDVDEIAEGERVKEWLVSFPLQEYRAIRLANYWYFRKACFRAKAVEEAALLVRSDAITYDNLMQGRERAGTYHLIEGKKARFVSKDAPLFHHYSWVRSKDEMLKKVRSWGHQSERNWEELVEEEFSREFSGKDFVHGYAFETVSPLYSFSSYSPEGTCPENVTILSTQDVHKIDLALRFSLYDRLPRPPHQS